MRYLIDNVAKAAFEDGGYVLAGEGGSIRVRFFFGNIAKIEYCFDGLEARSYSDVLTPGLPEGDRAEVSDEGESLTLAYGSLSVKIEKKKGNVCVFRDGALIHGGEIGTEDTVLPSHQARAFAAGGRGQYAHFNFPVAKGDEFYGLGDKTGRPNRRGRRFLMFNRDSLGYDASRSDPMYKSIPFFIKRNAETGALAGIFVDAPQISYVDFARESEFYYSWQVEGGPFSYFVIAGADYREVLNGYMKLTGFPYLPPRYSFGFFASSMNYADPDNSAELILNYFAKVEECGIPCEGLYFSSGYLRADDGKRYAFMWNRRKFPDVKGFVTGLRERGYRLIMNIKPGILKTHPLYEELAAKGYFIKDERGKPYTDFFWGGEASLIDFANPQAFSWWKEKLKETYLDNGCAGIWNDNNEFEIEDPEIEGYKTRTLLPLLMCKASAEAFEECQPAKRGWIYTRSGYAGIQRYARTWSGDNVSDWVSHRNNQYMSVGFGLSGMPFYGHDLGGFWGEAPSMELLIRGCQSAVFQPRFVIHSWREDGNPTEPWTYPEALPHIKALIKEHYRFMPYIYSAAIQAAITGTPMDRSLRLEFPQDVGLADDMTASLFGDCIVKVPVTEEGVASVSLRLPAGIAWFDGNTGLQAPSGVAFDVPAPLDGRAIWFARGGAAIATTDGERLDGPFERTEFLLFPSDEPCATEYYEDDGETMLCEGKYNKWAIETGKGYVRFTLLKKGLEAQGRTFSTAGVSFDPDALREGEEKVIEFRV